ncbi:MAG TPA: metallophosphoesterase [Ktedonobacterales bacterium]
MPDTASSADTPKQSPNQSNASEHSGAPRVAVIADLHGNLAATEAVLADLDLLRPDRVVIAGDFINRGPQGRAVLERMAPLGMPAISGNHDAWLAALARGQRRPPNWESSWWTPVRRGVEELTLEWVEWLEQLPFSLRVEVPGTTPLRIVHGSPRDNREGMGRRPSDADIAAMLATVEEPTVIGAHIHYPNERDVGEQHVVVVGAVGSPFNGDINAQYGLFIWDDAARRWRFEHRSVPYDHAPVFAAWRENGYLADGSVASALMLLEHQTARIHYVPFGEWASAQGLPHTRETYERYREEFDRPPLPE